MQFLLFIVFQNKLKALSYYCVWETYEKRMKINEIIFIGTKLKNPLKCQRISTMHLAFSGEHLAYSAFA